MIPRLQIDCEVKLRGVTDEMGLENGSHAGAPRFRSRARSTGSRDVQAVQAMSRHMSNLGWGCNARIFWVFYFMSNLSNLIQYSVEKKENVFDI